MVLHNFFRIYCYQVLNVLVGKSKVGKGLNIKERVLESQRRHCSFYSSTSWLTNCFCNARKQWLYQCSPNTSCEHGIPRRREKMKPARHSKKALHCLHKKEEHFLSDSRMFLSSCNFLLLLLLWLLLLIV